MSYLCDGSDEEEEYHNFSDGKEDIVFLIDATESMFDFLQFSLSIQCVENVMKNKAIACPDHQLAVILFGTDKTSNVESFEHIFVVQSLQKTSAESILRLKDLNECDFSSKFGHNKQFSLAEVFSLAIEELNESKVKSASKRVILFTSTPDPYSGDSSEDKDLRKIAFIRAKTFYNYNIEFDLIPLTPSLDKLFDVNAFYGEAFPHLKDDKWDNLVKLESLLSRIYNRFHKQRTLASIPFSLGSVGSTADTGSTDTTQDNFEKVESETIYLTQDSGEAVPLQQTTKNFNFGNETLVVNREYEKKIKHLEDPALTLLGFKPRTALMSHIHLKPGHFIFPDESSIKGSTTLFNALLKRCVERDIIPICRLTLKKGNPPQLVALYPQIESKPLDKCGGFHVVYLPFKEDVRELDIKNAEQLPISREAQELAVKIVNNLTFNYDPKNFPNPVLQNHWRVIECLALNQTIEPYDDSQTQPDYENIEAKAGYDMYCLNQMLDSYCVEPLKKAVKVPQNISELADKNQLGVCTVAELKEFCKQKNIFCGAKKAELIEGIRSYLSSNK